MSTNFNIHLARLADAVRALDGGADLARELLRLASDMDSYLEEQRGARYDQGMELFQKWNDFLNESVRDARRHHEGQLEIVRRQLARAVAADSRWNGGYADILQLLESTGEQ